MAEDLPRGPEDGTQPGEQVHLPGASYLPAWTAFGITIALVGVILTWVIVALGAAIAARGDLEVDRRDARGHRATPSRALRGRR